MRSLLTNPLIIFRINSLLFLSPQLKDFIYSHMTTKCTKSLHLSSSNQQMFDIWSLKMTESMNS